MKEIKYVVYRTTCNINNKIYIGVHKMDKYSYFDGYLGSGIIIVKAILKYGKENFSFEILHEFDNKLEAYEMEKILVTKEFVLRDDTYNACVGGLGGSLEGTHRATYEKRLIDLESRGLKYNY